MMTSQGARSAPPVEIIPGDRFGHMIETMFGLARLGYVNGKGMPNLLQMAMIGRESSAAPDRRAGLTRPHRG